MDPSILDFCLIDLFSFLMYLQNNWKFKKEASVCHNDQIIQ